MTAPARTANEQRIDELEVQLVTVLRALDAMLDWALSNRDTPDEFVTCINDCPIDDPALIEARSALSASTDYANKVVVDREEWETLLNLEKHAREWGDSVEDVDDLAAQLRIAIIDLPRLDSLRQGATHES